MTRASRGPRWPTSPRKPASRAARSTGTSRIRGTCSPRCSIASCCRSTSFPPPWASQPTRSRGSPKLKWCLRAVAVDPQRRRVFDIFFLKCEFVDEMGPVKARHQASMQEGIGKIESDLELAMARGQLPPDLDRKRAALFLHAFVGGCLRDALMLPPPTDFGAHIEAFVDACLHTLRTSQSLRGSP